MSTRTWNPLPRERKATVRAGEESVASASHPVAGFARQQGAGKPFPWGEGLGEAGCETILLNTPASLGNNSGCTPGFEGFLGS